MLQSQALNILKTGANVFLTGAPGAGKSYILREYVHFLASKDIDAAITAYTGIAASHINGRTLHSWAGLSFAQLTPEQERERVHANEFLSARIKRAKVLIIDEISMLRPEEFMRVDFICKTARGSLEPFGGLQLICCGDFFQIPPVNTMPSFDPMTGEMRAEKFVIDCPSWHDAKLKVCYLHEQHRQGDAALLGILDEIRQGNVSAQSRALLQSRIKAEVKSKVGIARLYTHNENVDEINIAELAKLTTPPVVYGVYSSGSVNMIEKLKKDYRVEKLVLKIGARVMFTRNSLDEGYANGTLGEIVDFVGSAGSNDETKETVGMITLVKTEPDPVVLTFDGKRIIVTREEWQFEEDGHVRASIRQLPLRLAWAITVHKSQGMTLDAAEIDLSRAFERGMGYVALSRVKSLENISLLGLNAMALEVNERIKKIDIEFLAQSVEAEQYLANLGAKGISRAQDEFVESVRIKTSADNKNGNDAVYAPEEEQYHAEDLPFFDFSLDEE